MGLSAAPVEMTILWIRSRKLQEQEQKNKQLQEQEQKNRQLQKGQRQNAVV
jgi:hypothetical protein